ncbi:MAG TPA: hypothetical protein DCX22_04715 [Dehalococcoidia bacterium]|nr:hypothetical protein [Dehalococcoidia bacterium]
MKIRTNVFDIAQYILTKLGAMTTWKLQKLCYYCQAWSLVWDDKPLFEQCIEAWANGPVIPELYKQHRGQFTIDHVDGADITKLSKMQKETIEAVLSLYGDKTSAWLSALTHRENPWKFAREREDLSLGERGTAEILLTDMAEYYEALCGEQTL